jgi:hypothetical protein
MRMSGIEAIVWWASSRLRGREIGAIPVLEGEDALSGMMHRALL